MRPARKLFLTAVPVLAVLALTASTASAEFEVHNEDHPEDSCGNVHVVETHLVAGGCTVEFESTEHVPIFAYVPAKTLISNCVFHLEAQIGEDGEGYVTDPLLTNEDPASDPPCTRQPCDEGEAATGAHRELLWPIHIDETAGAETLTLRFCIRAGTPQPEPPGNEGGAQSFCEVHIPLADTGDHNYEIGTKTTPEPLTEDEVFCEPGDLAFPASIEPHLINENDSSSTSEEDVEIVHSSPAPVDVHNEDHPEDPCGELHVVETHFVAGGCHIELESTEHMPLFGYFPEKTHLSNCDVRLEAQIGEGGEGYVTEAEFTNEFPEPEDPPCTRQPCDESEAATEAHRELLWPIHIDELAGAETLSIRLCLRLGTPHPEPPENEGGTQAFCTLHIPLADLGEHNYEIGTKTTPEPYTEDEVFCEPGDLAFPASFEPHFVNASPSSASEEDVELVH